MDRKEFEMDREAYLSGRAALKTKIKAMSFEQKRDKAILRMPRKTKEDHAALGAAIKEAGHSTGYGYDRTSDAQTRRWFRRQKITAYLNVYAKIRGKESGNPMGKDYYKYSYEKHVAEAQEMFDHATKPELVA